MNKRWPASFLSVSAVALGFCFGLARIARAQPSQVSPMRRPARYQTAVAGAFIRGFDAPRVDPMLFQLDMNFHSSVQAGGLPRYAPGANPLEKVKADRDEHGTQFGSLFISDRGLTLNLF